MASNETTKEQAQQESTDKLYWAVEQTGYGIYGVGETQDEATQDALPWLDDVVDSYEDLEEVLEGTDHGQGFVGDLRWAMITAALYAAVKEDGGDLPYTRIDTDWQGRPVYDLEEVKIEPRFTQKTYESIYAWAENADISHYILSGNASGVLPQGIVIAEEFRPIDDSEVTVRYGVNWNEVAIPEGYAQVNWGEENISLITFGALAGTCWIRYEWDDASREYHSDGNVYETEKKALNGWNYRIEGETPALEEVRDGGDQELLNFVMQTNDIGIDDTDCIYDSENGYFSSMDELIYEMRFRHGEVD